MNSKSDILKTIPLAAAVGRVLGHDITEINPATGFKGRRFRRGHLITAADLPKLRDLGKENIYIIDPAQDQLHEDEAVLQLAAAIAGKNVEFETAPKEGRINLAASINGLLKVDDSALERFNGLGEVVCATKHSNTLVNAGEVIAGTRAIPLLVEKEVIDRAVKVARVAGGLVSVVPLSRARVGVVITGNEVYYGRIDDAFTPVIKNKVEQLGARVSGVVKCPDSIEVITAALLSLRGESDLIVITGGMSVDADDISLAAARAAGVKVAAYGAPVLPGSMLMVGYFQDYVPVLGVPACALHHGRTVLDLVLPRLLADEVLTRAEIAAMGHGGLCLNCPQCHFPVCPFGK